MSFAALALRARAANDTTRAQINNIPSKSHVIPLFTEVEVANGIHLFTEPRSGRVNIHHLPPTLR